MKGTYRIIDRRRRHGLIRLCLAGRPDPGYTGDDWDDSPYERNAGPVCQDFVDATYFTTRWTRPDRSTCSRATGRPPSWTFPA